MKKIYIKPEAKIVTHELLSNINATSWRVDGGTNGGGIVKEEDPEGEIDSKTRWYDKNDWNSWD